MYALTSGDVKGAVYAASSTSVVLAMGLVTYLAFTISANNKYDFLAEGPLATFAGYRWLYLLVLLVAVGVQVNKLIESVTIFEGRRKM